MTTYYVSKEAAASDGNAGTSQSAPWLTISHALSSMAAHDTVLLRAGDSWPENLNPPSSKNGTSGNPTTFGAYGTGGNLKARITGTGLASNALVQMTSCAWLVYSDLELAGGASPGSGTTISGEHIVETSPSGGASHDITWNRCYIHGSNNCCVQSYSGPTPRSAAGSGTGVGDDANWIFNNCEIYWAANSCMIFHGSNLQMNGCHIHRWGDSNASFGCHGIYNHSPGSTFSQMWMHNDESSNPGHGQAISTRVTGVTVMDSIFHDCYEGYIFWYDNVLGVNLHLRNRGWNMFGGPVYFAAVSDTGPAYTWTPGSVPVDRVVWVKNTMHYSNPDGGMLELQDTSAKYVGGLTFADNIIIGAFSMALNMPSAFAANSGHTGALVEQSNLWVSTSGGSSGVFNYNGTSYSLASWKGQTVNGTLQGQGSFYTASPTLGLAPPGDGRRAPKPYMVLGVLQTQADNTLVSGAFGAPDFFPQSGSPVINVGLETADAAIAWAQG